MDLPQGRRRVALAGAGALLALVLVVVAASVAGPLGAPSVVGVENRFGPVNESTTVVESDVAVRNPNPVGAAAGVTVAYAVDVNDVRLATGERRGVRLPPGRSTVSFRTRVRNDRIPEWWVSHVRNGERTVVAVRADVRAGGAASFDAPTVTRTVETDLLSGLNSTQPRPVDAGLPVVSDPVLVVEETSAEWGSVTDEATPIRLRVVVRNPKPYPVGMTALSYDASMNGVPVGAGETDAVVVPPGATRTVETTAALRADAVDDWWVTHLRRNQTSTLRLAFAARIDVGGTVVEVPLDPLAYERTVETDLLGTTSAAGTADSPGVAGRAAPASVARPARPDRADTSAARARRGWRPARAGPRRPGAGPTPPGPLSDPS
jgi:LEA14-like dessication related protein